MYAVKLLLLFSANCMQMMLMYRGTIFFVNRFHLYFCWYIFWGSIIKVPQWARNWIIVQLLENLDSRFKNYLKYVKLPLWKSFSFILGSSCNAIWICKKVCVSWEIFFHSTFFDIESSHHNVISVFQGKNVVDVAFLKQENSVGMSILTHFATTQTRIIHTET